MKILFWNTHKNQSINAILGDMVFENDVSVIVLAEYTDNAKELVNSLLLRGKRIFPYMTVGCDRIHIMGSVNNVESGPQSSQASIQILNGKDILCCIHLQSQAYPDHEERRRITIHRILTDIRSLEKQLNTDNTIVVGDFNVNPYEYACIGASCFHSIPIHHEAIRKKRTVSDEEFYMFYNPMWNFFGDFNQPYGTYYYNGSSASNTYWHIYDQVIIRPGMKNRFVNESLQIITSTKYTSLLDCYGHPNKQISDHLPIIFEIKEE